MEDNNMLPELPPPLPPKPSNLPPPIPPKPTMIQQPPYTITNSLQTLQISTKTNEVCNHDTLTKREEQIYDTIRVSPPLPLHEVMTKFTNHIPLRLSVCESIYGIGGNSFHDGELFDVHFVKKTTVVHAISSSGRKLIVPINSSIQCSILYDPVENAEIAEIGFSIPTTGDLFKTLSLPQVVAVENSFTGKKKLSSFTEGEVLVLKGFDGRKKLKCISIPSNELKVLHESMKISFTTEASKIKLYLSDIVQHLRLPVKAMFYSMKNKQEMSMPYTLKMLCSEQSIIASDQTSEGSPHTGSIVEILTKVPITFEVVELEEDERQQLHKKSKNVFENFHPSCVKKVIADVSATETKAQTMVFQSVQDGQAWRNGVTLTLKPVLYLTDLTSVTNRCASVSSVILQTNYSYQAFFHPSSVDPSSEYSSVDSTFYNYPQCNDVDVLKDKLLHLQCSNIGLMKYVDDLKQKVDEG